MCCMQTAAAQDIVPIPPEISPPVINVPNLPSADCGDTDSSKCKTYSGDSQNLEEFKLYTAVQAGNGTQGSPNLVDSPNTAANSFGNQFKAGSTEDFSNYKVVVTDLTGLTGAIFASSDYIEGTERPSLDDFKKLTSVAADNNQLIISSDNRPSDANSFIGANTYVPKTQEEELFITPSVSAVSIGKGSAKNNLTLLERQNIEVKKREDGQRPGFNVFAAAVVRADGDVSGNKTVIKDTKLSWDRNIIGLAADGESLIANNNNPDSDHRQSRPDFIFIGGAEIESADKDLTMQDNGVVIEGSDIEVMSVLGAGATRFAVSENEAQELDTMDADLKDNFISITNSTLNVQSDSSSSALGIEGNRGGLFAARGGYKSSGNIISISDSKIESDRYNYVYSDGSPIDYQAPGVINLIASTEADSADNNLVYITNTTIDSDNALHIYGAKAGNAAHYSHQQGSGHTHEVSASDNRIYIDGSYSPSAALSDYKFDFTAPSVYIQAAEATNLNASDNKAQSNNNTVILKNLSINSNFNDKNYIAGFHGDPFIGIVIGGGSTEGYQSYAEFKYGSANNNTVYIKDSYFRIDSQVSHAEANIYSGWSNFGDASGNRTIIDGLRFEAKTTIGNNHISALNTVNLDLNSGHPDDGDYTDFRKISDNHVYITNSILDLSESHSIDVGQGSYKYVTMNIQTVSMAKNGDSDLKTEFFNNSIEIRDTKISDFDIKLNLASIWGDEPNVDLSSSNNQIIIGPNVTDLNGGTAKFYSIAGAFYTTGYTGTPVKPADYQYQGLSLTLQSRVQAYTLNNFQHYNFIADQETFTAGPFAQIIENPYYAYEESGNELYLAPSGSDCASVNVEGITDWSKGSHYYLIDSYNGFVDENGNKLSEKTKLDGVRTDLDYYVSKTPARRTHYIVPKEAYKLSIIPNDALQPLDPGIDLTDGGQTLVIYVPNGEPPFEEDDEITEEPIITPSEPGDVTTEDEAKPEAGAVLLPSLAAMASLYSADELLIDTALKTRGNQKLTGAFAATRGSIWYFPSALDKTEVFTMLAGYALHYNNLEFGPFFEAGHGSYSFAAPYGGSGNNTFGGVGLYANLEAADKVRLTAYLKGGLINMDSDLYLSGSKFNADETTSYIGAHAGFNTDINLNRNTLMRPFVSYFFDSLDTEDSEADIAGSRLHFETDRVESHRVQTGAVFEYTQDEFNHPFASLSYEYNFKAEATGTVTDEFGTLDLDSSDIEGGTLIAAAGWTYINQDSGLELNAGLNMYGGARNGAALQLYGNWRF